MIQVAVDGTVVAELSDLLTARDDVRARRPSGKAIVVTIGPGSIPLRQGLELGPEDSGTAESPIVWRGSGQTLLSGAWKATGFRPLDPIADAPAWSRVPAEARDHVQVCEIPADLHLGGLSSRGFTRTPDCAHSELYIGARKTYIAAWPNDGDWARIGAVVKPQDDGHKGQIGELSEGFHYDFERPQRWQEPEEAWIYGYWGWDWAATYERIASLDRDRRIIKTAPPYGYSGFRPGNRIRFLNLLEELDRQWEYYLDCRQRRLYFWPRCQEDLAEAHLTVLPTPLLRVTEACHLRFEQLEFVYGMASGVVLKDCRNVTLEQCEVRCMGLDAVRIHGGSGNEVRRCHLHTLGEGGCQLAGGDRMTLEPGRHTIRDSEIHDVGQWSGCYFPHVSLTGVGLSVQNCHLHHGPHAGIIYWGNDHRIVHNDLHDLCSETGDCGAIYTGRDYSQRGTLIAANYIHRVRGHGGYSFAIYLDDCASGQIIRGNVLHDCDCGMLIGGGTDNVVEDNDFLDCQQAIRLDGRGLEGGIWKAMVYTTMKNRVLEVKANEGLYLKRYPALARLLPLLLEKQDGIPPYGTVLLRNRHAGTGVMWAIGWQVNAKDFTLDANLDLPSRQSGLLAWRQLEAEVQRRNWPRFDWTQVGVPTGASPGKAGI